MNKIRSIIVTVAATATVIMSGSAASARPIIEEPEPYFGPTIWGSIWGTVRWLFPF